MRQNVSTWWRKISHALHEEFNSRHVQVLLQTNISDKTVSSARLLSHIILICFYLNYFLLALPFDSHKNAARKEIMQLCKRFSQKFNSHVAVAFTRDNLTYNKLYYLCWSCWIKCNNARPVPFEIIILIFSLLVSK